jgi:hypothetical protein
VRPLHVPSPGLNWVRGVESHHPRRATTPAWSYDQFPAWIHRLITAKIAPTALPNAQHIPTITNPAANALPAWP